MLSWIAFSFQTLWRLGDYVSSYYFFKGDRLHRAFVTHGSNFSPKTVMFNDYMCYLSSCTWANIPGFLFIARPWQHNSFLQKLQWRIHAIISESMLYGILIYSREKHKHILRQTSVSRWLPHTLTVAPPHAWHHSGRILHWVESLMRQAKLWSLALPSGAFKEAPLLSLPPSLHKQLAHIANWTSDPR